MKRLSLGVVGFVVIAGVVATLVARRVSPQPIYTVAQVQAGLAHHPRAWTGRTIVIRGAIVAAYYGPTSAGYQCGRGPMACPADVVDIPPFDAAHLLLVPAEGQGTRGAVLGSVSAEGSGSTGGGALALMYLSPAGDEIPTILLRVQPQAHAQAASAVTTLLRTIPLLRTLLPRDTQHRYPALGVYRVQILDHPTCSPAAHVGTLCDTAALQAGVAAGR